MPLWQELTDVLHPNGGDFLQHTQPGDRRGKDIYDATPRLAIRDLAATMDGLLKPKTANWFDVTIGDEEVFENDEVKIHLEMRRERMWNAVYRSDARFIQRSTETDMSLVTYGHGILWIQQNRNRDGLLFKSFPVAKVAIDENDEGIIDTIAVEELFTATQAERRFGYENLSQKLQEATKEAKVRDNKKWSFIQMVLPREDRDASKINSSNMPYASVVIDVAGEKIMEEGGFIEFPAAVPRWDTVPGEIYARSPGMMALPDAQTLQAMGKTLLIGGQRAVDPPLGIANDSVMGAVRNFPGGVTVFDNSDTAGGQIPIFPFPVSTNLPLGVDMQRDYRATVEAAFFKNVFNLPVEGPEMTATEVLQRKEEFIRVLGPVFGRQETDYVAKIVERVHGIMERSGAFGDVPEKLEDREITFRFQSPIQRARRQLEMANMRSALENLAVIAQANPSILDNFDGDKITRDAREWGGVPSKWVRPLEQVAKIRQQRAQAEQQEKIVDASEPIASAVKDVAQAQKLSAEI